MAGGSRQRSAQPPALTLGQLEASYLTYCKALRLLIEEGRSLAEIKRTVCWERLDMLHRAIPRQYRDPTMHYSMLKRHREAEQAKGSG